MKNCTVKRNFKLENDKNFQSVSSFETRQRYFNEQKKKYFIIFLFDSITCKECDEHFKTCTACSHRLNYLPHHRHHVTATSSVISGLEPHLNYVFKVFFAKT